MRPVHHRSLLKNLRASDACMVALRGGCATVINLTIGGGVVAFLTIVAFISASSPFLPVLIDLLIVAIVGPGMFEAAAFALFGAFVVLLIQSAHYVNWRARFMGLDGDSMVDHCGRQYRVTVLAALFVGGSNIGNVTHVETFIDVSDRVIVSFTITLKAPQ